MEIIKNFKLNFENGVKLGLWEEKPVYFSEPLSALIIAPPGSGKTTAIAIPNLLQLPTSCIVLDIKGELHDLTAKYRQKVLKNKILVFDFSEENEDLRLIDKLDFRTDNVTLYIKCNHLDFNRSKPINRLLEAINKKLFLKESKNLNERIYFILEEFTKFINFEILFQLISCENSAILLTTQSDHMIEMEYSKENAKKLSSMMDYKINLNENEMLIYAQSNIKPITLKTDPYYKNETRS